MRPALIVMAVFVLGVVTGGSMMYAVRVRAPTPAVEHDRAPLSPDQRADLLTRRLGLTEAQRAEVVDVLRRHVAAMRGARRDLQAAVRALLAPDQQVQFDALTRGGTP